MKSRPRITVDPFNKKGSVRTMNNRVERIMTKIYEVTTATWCGKVVPTRYPLTMFELSFFSVFDQFKKKLL